MQQNEADDVMSAETEARAKQEMEADMGVSVSEPAGTVDQELTVQEKEAHIASHLLPIMQEFSANMMAGTICRADVDDLLGGLVKFRISQDSPAVTAGVVIGLKPESNELVVFALTCDGQQIVTIPKSAAEINIGNVMLVQKLYDARTRLVQVEKRLNELNVAAQVSGKEDRQDQAIAQLQQRLDEVLEMVKEVTKPVPAPAPPASTTTPSNQLRRR